MEGVNHGLQSRLELEPNGHKVWKVWEVDSQCWLVLTLLIRVYGFDSRAKKLLSRYLDSVWKNGSTAQLGQLGQILNKEYLHKVSKKDKVDTYQSWQAFLSTLQRLVTFTRQYGSWYKQPFQTFHIRLTNELFQDRVKIHLMQSLPCLPVTLGAFL